MSVNNVTDAKALFSQAWNNVSRAAKKTEESERQKAMEMFGKALQDCEKASEDMMDKHHEIVVKSAKKLAEYHKRKAVFDRIRANADEQKMINERIVVNRLNQHNMLEEIRSDDVSRRELLKAYAKN
ncbi:MAG: hypothetical protein LBS93_00190 [Synergistaceae bacterium]|jgi:transglutaminase/protease-like cytokinesis protein 3|nr:hypothetical protein [Synergistaceae bacterium]